LFVVGELSNKIITYKVTYGSNGQLGLDNIASVSTFGNEAIPTGTTPGAGEIALSVHPFLPAPNYETNTS
jgi:hypothetical protein